MVILMTMVPAVGLLFLDPTLAPYLESSYSLESGIIGLIFAATSLLYVALCPLGSAIVRRLQNNRVLLFAGCFFIGIGFIWLGPSPDLCFGVSRQLWVTVVANLLIGVSNIFSFIPVVPELINILDEKYPHQRGEVNADISSALYSSSFALGSLLGPIIGGFLVNIHGFPRGASYLGIIFMLISIIYFLVEIVFHKGPASQQLLPPGPLLQKISGSNQVQSAYQ